MDQPRRLEIRSWTTTGRRNGLAGSLLPGVEVPQIRPGSRVSRCTDAGEDRRSVPARTFRREKGRLAIGLPLPPGCMPTVWRNDELFAHHYCGRFPGKLLYSTFDYATQDEDGYFFILQALRRQ
jgi:propionyl-CoA synthetase